MRRAALLAPPFLWLLAFVAAPVAILLAIALAAPDSGVPPFVPPVAWQDWIPQWQGTAESLATLWEDDTYWRAFLRSLRVAALSAALCLLIAYPMALGIRRVAGAARRNALLLLVLLPFWTGFLLRIGAWIGLLRDQGWINRVLQGVGLIEAPLPMLYSELALYVGMVHSYLPFAVLPLYAALSHLDPAL